MKVIALAKQGPEPVTVNGVNISAAAIANEAQHHPMPKGKPGWAWRAAAHALVMREVLLHEARALGIDPQPTELAPGRWETDDEAVIRQLLERVIAPAAVDDAGLRAVYESNPSRYRGPSLFEAAHILFAARPDDAQARAQAAAQAKAVLTELESHPRRFAALAREYSACPSGADGGVLGQLSSGDTVAEFEAALSTMAEGSISGAPVETPYGFHIIRLDARALGDVLPFDAVRTQLRRAHEKASWVRAGHAYMAALAARAKVTGIDLRDTPWVAAG